VPFSVLYGWIDFKTEIIRLSALLIKYFYPMIMVANRIFFQYGYFIGRHYPEWYRGQIHSATYGCFTGGKPEP
jgi:hypothetical protein